MIKSEKLFLLINEIDEELIEEADGGEEKPIQMKPEPRSPIKGIIALAACAAALAVGVFAIVKFRIGGNFDPVSVPSEYVSDTSDSPDSSDCSDNSDNSEQSSYPDISLEFTEDDLELQAILKDIQGGVNLIQIWYSSGAPLSSDGLPLTQEQKFLFPQSDSPDKAYPYYLIPGGYSREGDTTMPTTRADMMKIMLDYYSESYIDQYYDIGTGTMEENSDGTFSVVFDEIRNNYLGHFIEVNGRLYRFDSEGGGNVPPLNFQTAKLTHKTDDLIEFTFTDYQYGVEDPRFKYNASGILKYERGGWKLDQLKYNG